MSPLSVIFCYFIRHGEQLQIRFVHGATIGKVARHLHAQSNGLRSDLLGIQQEITSWHPARLKHGEGPSGLGILDSMSDGFLLLDRHWRIQYVNQAGARFLQALTPVLRLAGAQFWEAFPQLADTEFHKHLHRSQMGEEVARFEEYIPSLHCWLEVQSDPLEAGLAVYFRDITDRKQLEEQRNELLAREQDARAEAERATQALQMFLMTVSHELRTPLTVILGYGRLLQTRDLPPPQRSSFVEIMDRNAKLMSKLIEDLLDHCRVITGKLKIEPRPLELSEAVLHCVESARPAAASKNIELHCSRNGQIPVMGDCDRLQQVIANLLSNAVKFTPRGGRVDVRLERENGHGRVVVADTGIGIEPDLLPHVFEVFRQGDSSTTRAQGGLGLGLALASELARLHDGTIQAHSAGKDRGSTFVVTLPLATALYAVSGPAVRRPPGREINADPQRLDKRKILVVEDDADTRDYMTMALRDAGAEVRALPSGKNALRTLETFKPAVLISDLAMPGEDGFALVKRVRSTASPRVRRIPAIAVTAHAGHSEQEKALAAGFDLHLSKPIDPVELTHAVVQLITKKKQSRAKNQ